jgi:hypothetical protein
MKTKEEIIQDYWAAELRANQDKRIAREQEKAHEEALKEPTRYVGIFDADGVMHVVPARPVSKSRRIVVEVVSFVVAFFLTFCAASYVTLYL